jgi:hypothetical protein
MKAYALDLRERVVKFIQGGGSKAEAARVLIWRRVPFIGIWSETALELWTNPKASRTAILVR